MAIRINTNYTCLNPNNTGNRGRKGVKSDYKWIVVHYTGAVDRNRPENQQTAKNNCIYYRDSKVGASANYYVDSGDEVYMSVPWDSDRYAWHCGTGANNTKDKYLIEDGGVFCSNPTAIGVEICTCKMNTTTMNASDKDWYFNEKTISNAVELIKYLMKEFNIDINHIVRHYDVNTIHKPCPTQFVGNDIKTYYHKTGEQNWQEFKQRIASESPIITHDVCQAYTITSSDGTLNLRKDPNNSGEIIKVMGSGEIVLATKERSDGWMYVQYLSNNKVLTGWCFKKYLTTAKAIETRTVKSSDGSLNIRALPSTSGKLIVTMGNGYNFVVLRTMGTWGLIQCGMTIGYCNITNNYSYKK